MQHIKTVTRERLQSRGGLVKSREKSRGSTVLAETGGDSGGRGTVSEVVSSSSISREKITEIDYNI